MFVARAHLIVTAVVSLAMLSAGAIAAPITAFIFNNTLYIQTSPSAPVTPDRFFFSIGATQTPGDFNIASATYPGPGSPQSIPLINSTTFNFNSINFSTMSALHAAYPFGTYSITTRNTTTNTSTTGVINYTADLFTSTVPFLTNFSALTGLNPAASFTVTFPSFTPNPGATQGLTFFTISDATTGQVVTGDEFQPPSTTSFTIPANTLLANHIYDFELDFSDRLSGPLVGNAFTEQGFDLRTDGSFATGSALVPEPTSILLVGSSLLGLGLFRRRKSHWQGKYRDDDSGEQRSI
jgi:hypothetical protein